MFRKHLTILSAALLLGLTFVGTQAKADGVHFRFTGGSWSHSAHRGWHRYWGGPEIGFYFAPEPVYIVDGYDNPDYYTGPDFWYSNPSFGFGITLGGGYDGDYRDHYRGRADDYRGDSGRDRGGYRVSDHNYGGRGDSGYSGGSHNYGGSSFGGGGRTDRGGNSGGSQYFSGSHGNGGGRNDVSGTHTYSGSSNGYSGSSHGNGGGSNGYSGGSHSAGAGDHGTSGGGRGFSGGSRNSGYDRRP